MLIGIKDTDDNLVAATLICLSELVPILGADTVVGGKRSKLFTDGRPNSKSSIEKPLDLVTPTKSLQDLPCSEEIYHHDDSLMTLNERPSPVGGESIDDEPILRNKNLSRPESEEDWSDWDNSNRQLTLIDTTELINKDDILLDNNLRTHYENIDLNKNQENQPAKSETKINPVPRTLLQKAALEAKRNIVDISELDIKNQKFEQTKKNDEFDFFADMTPVIEKPTIVNVSQSEDQPSFSSKLNFVPSDELGDEGWGDNWNE